MALYDKPVIIQKQDPETEQWEDHLKLHAKVNKTGGGTALSAGADQYRLTLNFDFRYCAKLEDIRFNPQGFRLVYRDHFFKVADYDDYMEQHFEVRLVGELYA